MTELGLTALSVEISTIAGGGGGIRDRLRAEDVGAQALERVVLDDRHVLQRGGVEDQLGAECLAQRFHAREITYIGDDRAALAARLSLRQFKIDLPQRELAVVEQHQLGRRKTGDLARQFRPDAAAGACDQNAAALNQPGHAVAVERHLAAIEQILDGNRL